MRTFIVCAVTAAQLISLTAASPTEITLRSSDGTILKATWFDSAQPGPGVVLFHMCDGAGRAGWSDVGAQLAAAGISVLTFNYRGIEGSAGEPWQHSNDVRDGVAYWRSRWAADLDAAIGFVRSQPGVRRLGAGGASCGVTMALTAAERHADVRALALLSGPYHDAAPAFVRAHPDLSVFAAVSEEDGPAPRWMREIVAASKNPQSTLTVYNGAGHGLHMFAREPRLQNAIVDFFRSALQR